METFLIKSATTMAVLLGLYYLLLQREKMHRFNRFYLLCALVFSLAVPFITVVTYIEQVSFTSSTTAMITNSPTPANKPINYLFYIGWGLYAIVTLTLTIRFIKNVIHFTGKASQNPSVKLGNARLVLLEEKTLPHTFMNWIFVNRQEYENRSIEDELYTHEYTHFKQKHTLDILFIEALKTVFWFNPLIYFYKKAIQLNHEFLADEMVIDTTANTVYYQSLLLEKASVGTTLSLASNLNFSLTKKRFLMMTKKTSTAKAAILKIALTPVIAGLMMLLCTKTVAQQSSEPKLTPEQEAQLERFRISPEEEAKLKKTNPEMFSDDPAVSMKDTEFTFTDKKGNTIEKKGYAQLNDEQKKKVAMSPVKTAGKLNFTENPEITDPEFPGGIDAFFQFIIKGLELPKTKKDLSIKLMAKFTVEKDGSLTNYAVEYKGEMNDDIKEVLPQLEAEIIRVLKTSPEWKPALKDGHPVAASRALPIHISIND